ncbi:unnamed protein product [Prunus armeniaca]
MPETSFGDKQELPLSNFQKPNLLLQKEKNEDTQLWRTLLKEKEQGLKPITQFFHCKTQVLKNLQNSSSTPIAMVSQTLGVAFKFLDLLLVSIIYVSKMVGDSKENDDCVIADEMIYIPEVRNEERPKVGMKFDSLDFVYDFYNRYALSAKVRNEKIGFTKKDIYNFEYYESSLMKNHDVELVTEYFLAEHKNNRSFYFKIEGDFNDRLTRCFWADATSKRAYGFYGDVVVLDTTFNTNRYGLPFAPMLGVNNHGQTIVLACAFLSKETTESFIGMFEEFKKAMPGGEPQMIITDQDAAMARVIFEVFPTTFHQLFIWHITTKFSDKLPWTAYEEY